MAGNRSRFGTTSAQEEAPKLFNSLTPTGTVSLSPPVGLEPPLRKQRFKHTWCICVVSAILPMFHPIHQEGKGSRKNWKEDTKVERGYTLRDGNFILIFVLLEGAGELSD
jgi:hypothetical protein